MPFDNIDAVEDWGGGGRAAHALVAPAARNVIAHKADRRNDSLHSD
ncbi:hypothetical protein HW537_07675 [Asaia siamensis]